MAGNTGPAVERTVNLVGALRTVTTSRSLFFPQDLDTLDRATVLSFTLARPMTVTWTLRNAANQIVMTRLAAVALPAGTQTWTFSGRRSDGKMLPRGHYTSYVSATDGTLSAVQGAAFDMDAFVIKLNDSTPKRGQSITITATTAELLSKSPTPVHLPAQARALERPDVEGVRPHVPDHDPAQVQRWHRQGLVPGQGHRHQGRIAVHVRVVHAALTRPGSSADET